MAKEILAAVNSVSIVSRVAMDVGIGSSEGEGIVGLDTTLGGVVDWD